MAIAGVLLFGERLNARFVAGVLLAFFGLWLLLGADWATLPAQYRWGVWLGLGAGVCYAAYNVGIKRSQAEAGVGRAPVHFDVVRVVIRRLALDARRRPAAVDDNGHLRGEAAVVHVGGADQSNLLAAADGDLDRACRGAILDRRLDHFEDDGAPGLVVGAEDGRAVAADDVGAVPGGLDASARLDGVHVGGEEDRFAVTIAAAEDVACGILGYFEPEVAETAFELRCDGVLFARGGVDGHEFEEGLDDAIAVDHGALLRRGGHRSIRLAPRVRRR